MFSFESMNYFYSHTITELFQEKMARLVIISHLEKQSCAMMCFIRLSL